MRPASSRRSSSRCANPVETGVSVIVARPFNHTGPRQRPDFAAPGMARQIALIERGSLEPLIKVGNLDAERDLTDVRDTVRGYTLLMEKGVPGMVYNVASGVARSIRAVLDALLQRSRVPIAIAVDSERLRPLDTPVILGDASRLRTTTGWTPRFPFERTIDDLLAYWRSNVEQRPDPEPTGPFKHSAQFWSDLVDFRFMAQLYI